MIALTRVAALALLASLLLPWYERGSDRLTGFEAFARIDVFVFGAAVAALLAPALVAPLVARAVGAACGLGAALLCGYRIVSLPLVPDGDAFVAADAALAGPFLGLAAGLALAVASTLAARRSRSLAWPSETTIVAGLTAGAAVLRLAGLGEQSYWYDEFATIEIVGRGLGDAVDAYLSTESTPPLFYALSWPVSQLLGTGELAMRLLPALCGIATVPVVYLACRRLVSERAGVFAAALVAVNPTLVWYSQEARAYALLALLGAVTLWLLARALDEPTRRNVALWAVAAGLALLTHYFAIFFVAVEAVVLARRARPAALTGALALPAMALLLIPLALAQDGGDRAGFIAELPLGDRLGDVGQELISVNTLLINANATKPGGVLGNLAAASLVVAIAAAAVRRPGARVPLAVAAGSLLVPLALVPLGFDYFFDRNLIGAWPAVAIIVGAAFATLPRAAAAVALAVVAGAGLAVDADVASETGMQRAAWREAVAALDEAEDGRAIAVIPAFARGLPLFYGAEATPLQAGGVRTRELVLFGTYEARTIQGLGAFALVSSTQRQQLATVTLRAPDPVLLTPSTVKAAGLDPAAMLVDVSDAGERWIAAYEARVDAWSSALEGSALGVADPLPAIPTDLPGAAELARAIAAADAAGARWAAGEPGAGADFDAALARVPGAPTGAAATDLQGDG